MSLGLPLLLRCSCHCSVLQFDDLREFPDEGGVNEHMALSVGWLAQPYSLRARLAHAWDVLCGAATVCHETVISLDDVHALRRWLERYADADGPVTTSTGGPARWVKGPPPPPEGAA